MRREIGRLSRTSSVPRWRSPAIATAAKPTGYASCSPSATGCTDPSATAPDRLNGSAPSRRRNASGMIPDLMIASIWMPNVA